MASPLLDGPLYIEVQGQWEQCYCAILNSDEYQHPQFQVYERRRQDLPPSLSNRAGIIVHFQIESGDCDAKSTTISLALLSKLTREKKVPATPCFFNIKVHERLVGITTTYRFVAGSDKDRAEWIDAIKTLGQVEQSKGRRRGGGGGGSQYTPQYVTRASPTHAAMLVGRAPNSIMRSGNARSALPRDTADKIREMDVAESRRRRNELYEHDPTPEDILAASPVEKVGQDAHASVLDMDALTDDADEDEMRLFGLVKLSNLWRFFQVISAFPFATVLQALKFQSFNTFYFTRSLIFIRGMNGIVFFAVPVVLVDIVLQRFVAYSWIQRLTIGLHILVLAALVCFVACGKLWTIAYSGRIEEGTFSFKPARKVRVNVANTIQVSGLVLDWLLCCTYVLPRSVIDIIPQNSNVSSVPPYLAFSVYFWTAFSLVFASMLVIVLNATLRGKLLYKFQKASWVWYSFNAVGGPLFMTITTILFMSLWCNYSDSSTSNLTNNLTSSVATSASASKLFLVADLNIACYSNRHIMLARAGLIALTVNFLQFALLPAATFKESMSGPLDILFVPVFLSLQNTLKLIACFFFVFFYNDDLVRVVAISCVNILLLALSRAMQPCSVAWINTMQSCLMFHACVSSIHSLNLMAWQDSHATDTLLLSTVVSIVIFTTIGIVSSHLVMRRNTEYHVAKSFLDIEWQVSKASGDAGGVSPRALEQLISVTQSSDPRDSAIAKKYIGQIVWLLSYPNLRVQFQAAWALANVALLDEDARLKILESGGVAALYSGYSKMLPMAQLEALAALANLSLSLKIADDMARSNFIPFYMRLVTSNQTMHCVFACIAIGNMARKEGFRDAIRRAGGIQALVGCILSQNYQKRKYGMFALANMALSTSKEVQKLFRVPGLVDRIIKMAMRREVDTQREVVCLIRNLSCHHVMRSFLLEKGIMMAIQSFRSSVYPDVANWSETIAQLMEKEIASTGVMEVKSLGRRMGEQSEEDEQDDAELLKKMEPLDGRVDWATWSSKLDTLFGSMFDSVPQPVDLPVATLCGEPLIISLATALTKQTVRRWRDSIQFTIVSQPKHGVLDVSRTRANHCVTYAPHQGFTGKDSFKFRAALGNAITNTALVHISVEDPGNFTFNDAGFDGGGSDISSGYSETEDEQKV